MYLQSCWKMTPGIFSTTLGLHIQRRKSTRGSIFNVEKWTPGQFSTRFKILHYTGNGDVSIWVKNSRAGRKTVNNQSIKRDVKQYTINQSILTCITPPPWPWLEWRKQSGSSSILASQSRTTISSSVQAGLEAWNNDIHAVTKHNNNSSSKPYIQTNVKYPYPCKSYTADSIRENISNNCWIGICCRKICMELWGMPVGHLYNRRISIWRRILCFQMS
jgi:hypothetical protein